jgi:hypothetical protein
MKKLVKAGRINGLEETGTKRAASISPEMNAAVDAKRDKEGEILSVAYVSVAASSQQVEFLASQSAFSSRNQSDAQI